MTLWVLWGLIPALEAEGAECASAPAGLVGWWTGDSNGNDAAGGNNGVLQGGATAGGAGRVGGAFSFDGTNSYVAIADASALKPANLTLEVWVNFSDLESSRTGTPPNIPAAGDQYLVFKQNSRPYNFEGYALEKHRTANGDTFRFTVTSAAGQDVILLASTVVSTSVWYHVAAVRGANFIQIYVNGQLENQASVGFPQDYGTLPLYFGTSQQSYWDAKLKGRLDEVSLYNRALSGGEIAGLFAAGAAGKCKGPTITVQPQSQEAVVGSNVVFTVGATGYGTLSYQWRRNGGNVAGATGSSLALNNVQPSQAGSYSVVVTNTLGAATSAVAVLTVLEVPVITAQPQSRTNVLGTTASFSVTAAGMAPLSYQWQFNGVAISGATESTLVRSGVLFEDAGSYRVVVTNPLGSVTSAVAVLTVICPAVGVSPGSLPEGVAGRSYSQTLTASGGMGPYVFTVSGGSLPAGLGLSSEGVVSGIPGAMGTNSFTVRATDTNGCWGSQGYSLMITGAVPAIVVQPQSRTNVLGTTASFSVTAAGTAPLSYQWRFNGAVIAGATESSYARSGVTFGDGGGYQVVITNALGVATSTVAVLTVICPAVSVSPASLPDGLVGSGYDQTLTASGGTGPYVFMMNGGGVPLGLSLTAGGVLSGVPSRVGTNIFTVKAVYTNGCYGSHEYSLAVTGVPPVITQQPQSRTNNPGTTASFSVTAVGTVPLSYQWEFNGAAIPGATESTLVRSGVTTGDDGGYRVVVTNAAGVVTSAVAVLTVQCPVVSVSPASLPAGLFGSEYSQTLTASGGVGAYGFTVSSGTLPPGLSLSSAGLLSGVPNAIGTNSFTVRAAYTNGCWGHQDYSLAITGAPPVIVAQPQSRTNVAGTAAMFTASAAGTALLSYRWQFNGVALADSEIISGASSNRLDLAVVQPGDAGSYTLVVSNAAGVVTSAVATLLVTVPPAIHVGPASRSAPAGANAVFSVTASGTMPLGYQWQFNGAKLSGATGMNLAVSHVQATNAGSYSVIVTNVAGAVTSGVAVLTVLAPPMIVVQPESLTNELDSVATFSVTAAGSGPLAYQWYWGGVGLVDGERVSGAVSDRLQIAAVQSGDAGDYRVVVSNAHGAVTSIPAALTVVVPPAIVVPPESVTVVLGASASFSVAASGTPPLSYQWRFNGQPLPGATGTSHFLGSAQPADAGAYTVVVTNAGGAVTSTVANLTVLLPPLITMQPASLNVSLGMDAGFSVAASGTPPLGFQWQFNGQPLVGATGTSLLLTNVQLTNAGGYSVVVTNNVGSITSAVAHLAVIPSYQPDTQSAGAMVLVNSQSAKYLDFQRFIQPYLDNFGFPYTVQDISTNAPGPGLTNCAVIILGHSQLDTNLAFLTPAAQTSLSQAVSNGTGLVSFDNDLSAGGVGRYQFVQDIFGFSYGTNGSGNNVILPPTEPSSQMHYITARHPTSDTVALRSSLSLPGLTVPAAGTTLARVGSRPLVVISKSGQGRAVQWSSYGWMVSTVLGPLAGLDDVVWRGVVWAARKPFVMRGQPHLVTMRVDDVKGPFDWVHHANAVGFKPFVTVFMSNVVASSVSDLRGLTTSGQATASIHSFDCCNRFFYFNHTTLTANSDLVQSNNFYLGTQWHLSNGIPMSKVCAPHYSEIGPNCFAGLQAWGIEYVPIEVVPGTVEYTTPGANWLVAGPYRRYETPRLGQLKLPTYYADWLTVPGHPEFDGQFFNVYSEPRDETSCGEWCPDNDVAGSVSRAVRIARRGLDSMVLCTIYGHEYDFYPISAGNWEAIFQGITNELAPYNPVYVTLDYACQYVRATRTSRLVSSAYDPVLGQVTARFTGQTDLDTQVSVFTGEDNSITNEIGLVPMFTEAMTNPVVVFGAPAILCAPSSQTLYTGTTAVFSVSASGTGRLSYQWYRDWTNPLSDTGMVNGAGSATLTLSNVLPADAGSYSVVVSNGVGSVASPAAILTVVNYPVLLTAPTATNGAFGFTLSGEPGQVYVLDVSTNLRQWEPLAWLTNLTGQVYFTDPAASNSPSRFYRARGP